MSSVCAKALCLAVLATMIMTGTTCRELFVTPTSDVTLDCPGVPCLTLKKYVEMSDMFITSNMVFKLLPGQHVLNNPLIFQDIENFTIEGEIAENSPYPVIQYTTYNDSMARPALHFNNSFNITLRAVKFDYIIDNHNREIVENENTNVAVFEHGSDVNIVYSSISIVWSYTQPPFIGGYRINNVTNVNITEVTITGTDFIGVIFQDSTNVILSGVQVTNSSTAISINATENIICYDVYITNKGHVAFDVTTSSFMIIQNMTLNSIWYRYQYGIRTSRSSHISIVDTVIDVAGSNGIYMRYGSFVHIYAVHMLNTKDTYSWPRLFLCYLQNVTVTDSVMSRIVLIGTDNVTVSHISLSSGIFGRHNTYTSLHYIMINMTHDFYHRRDAIGMHGTSHLKIFHSSINNSTYQGIQIYTAEHIIIANTSVSNTHYYPGVHIVNANHITISNTTVCNTRDHGIYIENGDFIIAYYTSVDNTTKSGVLLQNTNFTRISHSHINNSLEVGVRLERTEHTNLSNTTASNAGDHGLTLLDTAYTTVLDMSIKNTTKSGVVVENTNFTRISHCHVNNSKEVGVMLERTENTTLSNTTVNNSGLHGMIFLDIVHTDVLDVSVNNSNSNGIEIHNATNTTMSHVVVENSGLNGMELSHMNHMVISHNNITNARWNGMQLRDTENVNISYSTVSNAGWNGIELCHSTLTSISSTAVIGQYTLSGECFKQCSYDPTMEVMCRS